MLAGLRAIGLDRAGLPAAMFDLEADGLRWLRETNTARVPRVLHLSDEPGAPTRFLVLEWIDQVTPEPAHHEDMGHRLAALHRIHEPAFGFDQDNYIGSLPQINGPCSSWPEFYATRRRDPLVAPTSTAPFTKSRRVAAIPLPP